MDDVNHFWTLTSKCFCRISGWLANKVVHCSWSRYWYGIPTFNTSSSCHSWRLETTECSSWWRSHC